MNVIDKLDAHEKRADLPEQNEKAVFARMQAERERQAKQYRAEGAEEAQKVRSEAEKDRDPEKVDSNAIVKPWTRKLIPTVAWGRRWEPCDAGYRSRRTVVLKQGRRRSRTASCPFVSKAALRSPGRGVRL